MHRSERLHGSPLIPKKGRFPTGSHEIAAHSRYAVASFPILLSEYFRPSNTILLPGIYVRNPEVITSIVSPRNQPYRSSFCKLSSTLLASFLAFSISFTAD